MLNIEKTLHGSDGGADVSDLNGPTVLDETNPVEVVKYLESLAPGVRFFASDSPELQDFLESRNGHVVSLEDSSTLGDDVLDIGCIGTEV